MTFMARTRAAVFQSPSARNRIHRPSNADRDPRKLRQTVQILKRIGEGIANPVSFQKMPQPHLDSCRLPQRLTLAPARTQRLGRPCILHRIQPSAFLFQRLSLVATRLHQISDAITIHRIAQLDLGIRPYRLRSRRRSACCRRSARPSSVEHRARRKQRESRHRSRREPSASCQNPTTILRLRRMRAPMNPNSRSPWADWLRFMKSMSMLDQGSSLLNCVWRCRNGLFSIRRSAIHIRAGENVCIHVISPTQFFAPFASRHNW